MHAVPPPSLPPLPASDWIIVRCTPKMREYQRNWLTGPKSETKSQAALIGARLNMLSGRFVHLDRDNVHNIYKISLDILSGIMFTIFYKISLNICTGTMFTISNIYKISLDICAGIMLIIFTKYHLIFGMG